MAYEISVLIPARNEEWLNRTIEDILENSSDKTEIIVVLDGDIPKELPPIHERVTVVALPKSIGQRAATNLAARMSMAKWIIKTDAHCAFDKDFDTKLLADTKDNWTIVPAMRNLHAFDWVCPKGHRRYQGPSGPCTKCKRPTVKDVLWHPKESPRSRSYCFDPEPHFQYFGEHLKGQKNPPDITESMSLQGSFFMITRKRYWELNICDEGFGSWGSQGIEVACKTWLTGGRVICNNKTWYAHLFRTQGGDFGFPYPQEHGKIHKMRPIIGQQFFQAKWRKQIYPLSWLLERFWPIGTKWSEDQYIAQKQQELQSTRSGVCSIENFNTGNVYVFGAKNIHEEGLRIESFLAAGQHPNQHLQEQWSRGDEFRWHVEMFCRENSLEKHVVEYEKLAIIGKLNHKQISWSAPKTKGILYYTDGNVLPGVKDLTRKWLKSSGLPITAVGLKPTDIGDVNITMDLPRGSLAMAKQILTGLEAMKEDIVYFCEHDCVYPQSHFDYTPSREDIYAYDINVWKLNVEKGYGLSVDDCRQLSGLCAYRTTLIDHYRERVKRIESEGWSNAIGHEPGTHNRKERIDNLGSETYKSGEPIVDIRLPSTFTKTKWNKSDFRNQKYTEGWTEDAVIPYWGPCSKIIENLNIGG